MAETNKTENQSQDKSLEKNTNEEILAVLKELKEANQEILKLNNRIAESASYLERYFHLQAIFTGIKWVIIIAILVLGIISLSAVFDYVKDSVSSYSGNLSSFFEARGL